MSNYPPSPRTEPSIHLADNPPPSNQMPPPFAPQPFSIDELEQPDAYAKIEAEIMRCRTYLSSLYYLQNSSAPVSKLPLEVLSQIFTHAEDEDSLVHARECRSKLAEERTDLGLQHHRRLVISWVCQRWRYLALQTPSLWRRLTNDIDSENLRYTQECITRSRDLPFFVIISSMTNETVDLVVKHINRIQYLLYSSHTSLVPMAYFRPLRTTSITLLHAPHLESLDVSGPLAEFQPLSTLVYPQLRCLRLSHINPGVLHWRLLFSPGLTTLIIEDPISHITVKEFWELLKHLPKLIRCELKNVFPGSTSAPCYARFSLEPLKLADLRVLEYQGHSIDSVFGLFYNLEVPQAHLHAIILPQLRLIGSPVNVAMAATCLNTYRTHSGNPFNDISFYNGDNDLGFSVELQTSPSQNRLKVTLELKPACNFDPVKAILGSLTAYSESIESLRTNYLSEYSAPLLGSLPALKTLVLSGSAIGSFLLYWEVLPSDEMAFPALKELVLNGVGSVRVDFLVSQLTAREQQGLGLNKLTLDVKHGFRMNEDDITALRKVVNTLFIQPVSR